MNYKPYIPTLFDSERPKLYAILVFLSAIAYIIDSVVLAKTKYTKRHSFGLERAISHPC